ncbi:hypothetical protein D9757_004661 [Collybiopsis confluens]|uniref:RFX-type winged-helix domain-containing protein n=1 Tax=Collybiopsis confluens TaxID=2823264 RepID=A0A8H5HSB0_9AGAR|nr:hypothetical protein D9757_004661 [Collybiopsis confluens]
MHRGYVPGYYANRPGYVAPDTRDDHERWFTEVTANNRMRLSLLSDIDSEIEWALDRLMRLCKNENFVLKGIPGLLDALFEWPEWFATIGYQEHTEFQSIFVTLPVSSKRRRHSIMSVFILCTAVLLNDQNALDLASSQRTLPLVLHALHNLDSSRDAYSEFIYYILEIFHVIAPTLILPPYPLTPSLSPLQPLLRIASQSSNRSTIISALRALTILFSTQPNTSQLSPDSPALSVSLKHLPLFDDKALLEVSLSYLYAHLSQPALSKAFLRHHDMPGVLRILVLLLLKEQVQEISAIDITGDVRTVPSTILTAKDHELTEAEFGALLSTPEPKRSLDWIAVMFVPEPDAEILQVNFWRLYDAAFQSHQDTHPMLSAEEFLKGVNTVFEQHAQVIQREGTGQFVIRGIQRRKDATVADRLKCQWHRSQCAAPPCANSVELSTHVLEHIDLNDNNEVAECQWSSCFQKDIPKERLRAHVLTHFWSQHLAEKHPTQSDTITLSHPGAFHPDPNPTRRPPPAPPSTRITFPRTVNDAPSLSLLALLCIRILFRTSFASVEAAPKVDGDHFGFPGLTEENEDDGPQPLDEKVLAEEKTGGRRGRKAFAAVRKLFEDVQIRDENLMGWITEMIDAGMDPEGLEIST